MHEQTVEAPRWVGFLLLAVGMLLFVFGRRLRAAWTQSQTKLRERFAARVPYLRQQPAAAPMWHTKMLLGFIYLFAGMSLFAGAMTLFRP